MKHHLSQEKTQGSSRKGTPSARISKADYWDSAWHLKESLQRSKLTLEHRDREREREAEENSTDKAQVVRCVSMLLRKLPIDELGRPGMSIQPAALITANKVCNTQEGG